VGEKFKHRRATQRGADWRESMAETLLPHMSAEQAQMLKAELDFQQHYSDLELPWGVTHSDLFRDNALFVDNELQGIIDFYYACDEFLIYDLAVAVNDWCVNEQGLIDHERYQRLMDAYLQRRQLNEAEQSNWNLVCRAAALRFWLSRLQDQLFPREGEMTQIKNPDAFLKILQQHRHNPLSLNTLQNA
ncbi:phosphotransferase, partial [Methylophaga sp. UBA1464]